MTEVLKSRNSQTGVEMVLDNEVVKVIAQEGGIIPVLDKQVKPEELVQASFRFYLFDPNNFVQACNAFDASALVINGGMEMFEGHMLENTGQKPIVFHLQALRVKEVQEGLKPRDKYHVVLRKYMIQAPNGEIQQGIELIAVLRKNPPALAEPTEKQPEMDPNIQRWILNDPKLR